jgi:UDP-N-acetylmuramate--alanine ligase
LDYYKDIEDIKSAFRELALKVPGDGFVVCDPTDANLADVIKDIPANVVDYKQFLDLNLKLKVPGLHNKRNASEAITVAAILGIGKSDRNNAIASFAGTWRRFEFKGTLRNGTMVYDDYAHHPKEITSTLQGFRELYPKNDGWNITVIFQPHLFSRTKLLLNDFAQSFSDADEVILLPIYYAREEDDGTISSDILRDEVNKYTNNSKSFKDFEKAEEYLINKVEQMNDKNIVVTMGAGEAFKISDFLVDKYKN